MITTLFASLLLASSLTITPSFDASRWLDSRERIELRFSEPAPSHERIAVFAGNRDVTTLFEAAPGVLRYRADVPPLPAGEQEIIVYAVAEGKEWRELGRFPIKVLTRRGFEKATAKPALDLTNKGQIDQGQTPPQSFSSREHYQDFTAQGGLTTELQRGDFLLRTQANVTGVSYINEALRYGEKAENAPHIDLANYRVELQKGFTSVALGHVGFGSHRHLINGFSSRGVVFTFGAGKPVSVALGAMNGTAIVGWDNIIGFQERQHRVYSATLGVELVPSRPGAARIEASLLDGSLLPLNGFTEGAIRSAEKSRGGALRVLLSDSSQRFTIDGGWTRSRFRPQQDLQVEEGLAVSAIPETERDAAYLDASVAIIRNKSIGKQSANVSATFNFERVDPLFRSVTASPQADYQRGALSLNGTLGPLTLQVSHARSEDNLDGIRSILKTKTRQTTANAGLSLATLFGARRGARWIPSLTATVDHTHQFGAFLPVDAGFSASHVPDQISFSAQTAIEWQLHPVRFGLRGSTSNQNNRQPGRERADFETDAGSVFLGFTPTDRFDISFDTSLDEQKNIESATRQRNRRVGATMTWRFFRDFALAANRSETFGRDGAHTNERQSSDSFVELSTGFRLWRNAQSRNASRLFVRYANREQSTFDRIFNLNDESDGWTLTSGVNVSFF